MEQVSPPTKTSTVAIFDYGSGNLRSTERAVVTMGAEVIVTADPKIVMGADGLLVPGVGAYAACMEGLHRVQGPCLIGSQLVGGRPAMGVCVGMQVLFDRGVEYVDGIHAAETDTSAAVTGTPGCGEWPGIVERLEVSILPHMGWNTVEVPEDSKMFKGLEDQRFYFVHSYDVRKWDLDADSRIAPPLVTWSAHESDQFVAAVENGPLRVTQFYPEKSGEAGLKLLQNWVDTLWLSNRQYLP